MTWSHVNGSTNSGSSSTTITTTLPASLQDGDILVCTMSIDPDNGTRDVTTSTPGWTVVNPLLETHYFCFARYSSALAAPTFSVTGGSVAYRWAIEAFRPTKHSALAGSSEATGNPPTAFGKTVIVPDELVVVAAIAGLSIPGWSPASGFSAARNITTSPALHVSYRNYTSAGAISGIRTTVIDGGDTRNGVICFVGNDQQFRFFGNESWALY